jgi:hypothetical protein
VPHGATLAAKFLNHFKRHLGFKSPFRIDQLGDFGPRVGGVMFVLAAEWRSR